MAEIGTPLILREGAAAIRAVRAAYPDLPLVADFKIMDAGEEEAAIAFDAGANMVTVLGVAGNATVAGAVKAARRCGGQVMVDLIQVATPAARSRDLLAAGCDYVCVHTAFDDRNSPLAALHELRQNLPDAPLAVAGGINLDNIDAVATLKPALVIAGSAITRSDDPAATARAIRKRMNPYA
jgi:3-hexulose-6-phosphate synthase